MIPIEQKAPPGDRAAAEWNHVAYATRRRRRILLRRILSYQEKKRRKDRIMNLDVRKRIFIILSFLLAMIFSTGHRRRCLRRGRL